jgi:hypothetical protein
MFMWHLHDPRLHLKRQHDPTHARGRCVMTGASVITRSTRHVVFEVSPMVGQVR